jgi:hypothetical protein
VGVELFHVDGRADRHTNMTKLRVAFRNFANAPKNTVPTSQQTYRLYITWANRLMLHNQFPDEKDRDGSRNVGSLAIQPPDASHSSRKVYWIWLMWFQNIIVVYCKNMVWKRNTLLGDNWKIYDVKTDGIHSCLFVIKDHSTRRLWSTQEEP